MENDEITRRDFVSMTVGASIAAAAGAQASAQQRIVETNVEIKTADGACDAAFIHPSAGSYPGVLIWTDAFGLRPPIAPGASCWRCTRPAWPESPGDAASSTKILGTVGFGTPVFGVFADDNLPRFRDGMGKVGISISCLHFAGTIAP